MDIVSIIFVSLACAVFAYEMVNSMLAYRIKGLLLLDRQQPVITLLSSYKAHKKLLGKLIYPLLPLSLTVILLALAHRFIQQLLECPYCVSFWVGLIAAMHFTLPIYILPFTSMLACRLYNLIVMKGI